jgi:hypothetical protein
MIKGGPDAALQLRNRKCARPALSHNCPWMSLPNPIDPLVKSLAFHHDIMIFILQTLGEDSLVDEKQRHASAPGAASPQT